MIVGEEVKTADQGEVIGLFIEEKIPRGNDAPGDDRGDQAPGRARVRAAPVRPLHSVPDYEHLLDVLDDVDAIEVFNPRVAITEFNDEAARFAAKYRIPAGAGSDAHVPQGLGSVRIRMREFDGPEEFLESLQGRRHRPQAGQPAVRPGAQVPADQGAARGRPDAPRANVACGARWAAIAGGTNGRDSRNS